MGADGGALPLGAPLTLLSVRVAGRAASRSRLPERLTTFADEWRLDAAAPIRAIPLGFRAMQWLLDGRTFAMDEVSANETAPVRATRVWEFSNSAGPMGMQMAHPIHLHGRQFRVVRRSGGSAANALREGLVDAGWTDTVLVLPDETVRIQVTFSEHPGLYLYHCHILEHEDMGMMRNFRLVGS
jgi:FtsP/CotA-like multicopper oxidase with cupredoxin domain